MGANYCSGMMSIPTWKPKYIVVSPFTTQVEEASSQSKKPIDSLQLIMPHGTNDSAESVQGNLNSLKGVLIVLYIQGCIICVL